MGLLYAIFSIFITLFFPKQITDVIVMEDIVIEKI